jgi:DNA-binding transcriptional LysR family regulator
LPDNKIIEWKGKMDRLVSMAVFVAAVDEGSLVSAARRFGLSPSMAGKHVSAIEEQLNARLLQRTTRALKLTDVGQAYYTRCKRILEEYEDANREAADAQQTVRGILRVAAPTTFGAMHLGSVIASYLAAHPAVTVETALSDRYVTRTKPESSAPRSVPTLSSTAPIPDFMTTLPR